MKTSKFALGIAVVLLAGCVTEGPDLSLPETGSRDDYKSTGGAASFRLSEADYARHANREALRAEENAASMAQPGGTVMYQQNETGLFGTRSSSGVIRSTGGVQSYQTIGGQPVGPGTIIPGYNYPAPSVNGGPGTYIDARTGRMMYKR